MSQTAPPSCGRQTPVSLTHTGSTSTTPLAPPTPQGITVSSPQGQLATTPVSGEGQVQGQTVASVTLHQTAVSMPQGQITAQSQMLSQSQIPGQMQGLGQVPGQMVGQGQILTSQGQMQASQSQGSLVMVSVPLGQISSQVQVFVSAGQGHITSTPSGVPYSLPHSVMAAPGQRPSFHNIPQGGPLMMTGPQRMHTASTSPTSTISALLNQRPPMTSQRMHMGPGHPQGQAMPAVPPRMIHQASMPPSHMMHRLGIPPQGHLGQMMPSQGQGMMPPASGMMSPTAQGHPPPQHHPMMRPGIPTSQQPLPAQPGMPPRGLQHLNLPPSSMQPRGMPHIPGQRMPQPGTVGQAQIQGAASGAVRDKPQLLQEKPLLIQDLLEQERREQQRQMEQQAMLQKQGEDGGLMAEPVVATDTGMLRPVMAQPPPRLQHPPGPLQSPTDALSSPSSMPSVPGVYPPRQHSPRTPSPFPTPSTVGAMYATPQNPAAQTSSMPTHSSNATETCKTVCSSQRYVTVLGNSHLKFIRKIPRRVVTEICRTLKCNVQLVWFAICLAST